MSTICSQGSAVEPCSGGKTLKTAHSTTRNWNVDELLHIPLQRGKGYDRRHFHSCSASCGSRTGVRAESSSMRILGTSIICSGTWKSCGAKTSTNSCSSISGTGTSIIGAATICSTVCRWSRSCGLTSESRSGRENPTAGTSSTSKAKCWVPAAWGVGVLRIDAV